MKAIRAAIVLACVAFLAACADRSTSAETTTAVETAPSAKTAAALTEPQVRAFVEEVEVATRDQDVDAMASQLADDARFTMHVPEGLSDGPNPLVMDKDQMLQDTRKEKELQRERTYASTIDSVTVAPDGSRATAGLTVTSESVMEGTKIQSISDQTYTIELRGDRPQLTAVAVKVTGLTVDGEKRF